MNPNRRSDAPSQIFLAALAFIAAVAILLASTGCYVSSDDAGHAIPIGLYPAAEQATDSPAGVDPPLDLLLVELGKGTPSLQMKQLVRARRDLVGRVILASGMTQSSSWHWDDDDDEAEMTLARLLGVARAAGADCLVLVGGTAQGQDRLTALSVLDLTVIGAYLVPSHVIRVEARSSAIVVDVATGGLVATGSSEHRSSLFVPSFTADGVKQTRLEEVVQTDRVAALKAALDELAGAGR